VQSPENRGCHGHFRTVLFAIISDQYQKNTTISSALMLYSHTRYLLMPIVRAGFGLNILNPPHPISLQPFDVAIISRFANSGQFDNTFLPFAGHRSRCCVEQVRAEVVSATTRRKNNMQVDFRGVLRHTKPRIADGMYPRAQPLVSVHSLADCRRCLLTRGNNLSRSQEETKPHVSSQRLIRYNQSKLHPH